jgi:5-(carboxyamino)imidazole ribonucleotide synthase
MRIGIVGGGQLGLYLCRAARQLGIASVVLSATDDCPAAAAADQVLVGGLDDVGAAAQLAAAVDVLTFEIESVAPAVLEHLCTLSGPRAPLVAPSAATMLTLQNKTRQKAWLQHHRFPTADHVVVACGAAAPDALLARFGLPLVQKSAFGGYDGRGVQVLRTRSDLDRLWTGPSVVEAFVPHEQEIAVLTARGRDGTIASYPPVAMRFDPSAHVLETVTAPARLSGDLVSGAVTIAERVVGALGGIGLFAVEMFVIRHSRGQTVLINEISPRVHNAGHLTMEAFSTSQFSQHLRAVAGLPLGPVELVRPAVMKNILYTPGLAPSPYPHDYADEDVYIHWYGKKGVKPLRKVGHLTALAADAETAEQKAQAALRSLSPDAGEGGR